MAVPFPRVSGGTSPATFHQFAISGEKARCPQTSQSTSLSGHQTPRPPVLSACLSFGVMLVPSNLSLFSEIEQLPFFVKASSRTRGQPDDAIVCNNRGATEEGKRMAAKGRTCWHLKCCLSKKLFLNFSF